MSGKRDRRRAHHFEALNDAPAKHRPPYDAVTTAMGGFKADRVSDLHRKPIAQLWRDHMLAGAIMLDSAAGWEGGLYAFVRRSFGCESWEPCLLYGP